MLEFSLNLQNYTLGNINMRKIKHYTYLCYTFVTHYLLFIITRYN